MLAHCAAALSRVIAGNLHAFTPALNEIDVAERRARPLEDILSELAVGYLEAGKAITEAGGKLDVLALGEWLHGGDVATLWVNRSPTQATDTATPARCWPDRHAAARQPRSSNGSSCPAAC